MPVREVDNEPQAAPNESPSLGESAASKDSRVSRLEDSLSTLQSLLPAERTKELEAIGRAWVVGGLFPSESELPPQRVEMADTAALSNQVPVSPEVPTQEVSVWSIRTPEGWAPDTSALDSLRAWIDQNPLTAIAVGPSRGIAAFGGQFYGVGDELPRALGQVTRIEARAVVLLREGVECRIPLSAFVPRSATPATIQQPPVPAPVMLSSAPAKAVSPLDAPKDPGAKAPTSNATHAAIVSPSQGPGGVDANHHL